MGVVSGGGLTSMGVVSGGELCRYVVAIPAVCRYVVAIPAVCRYMVAIPAVCRYVVAIPAVCAEFLGCCSHHAPEEKIGIGEKAINLIHTFLEAVAKEIHALTLRLCHERISLSSNVRMIMHSGSCHMTVTCYIHYTS